MGDVVNVKNYGAKGDGSTDDTAFIQAAINAARQQGGATVFLPNGIYPVLNVQVPSHVHLMGDTNTVLLKKGGGTGTHIIECKGSPASVRAALTARAALGARTLAVASTTGFQAGDFVVVRDGVYKYSNMGRNQEINIVTAIGPGTLTLENSTIGVYDPAKGAEVVKLNAVAHVKISNLQLKIENGTNGGNLMGNYCYHVLIEDCVAMGPNDDPAFGFENSARCVINRCEARDGQQVARGGYGYGFCFAASTHNSRIQNCFSQNIRENLFTDNARYCAYLNSTDYGSNQNMINTHASGSEHILISGNVSVGSLQYGINVGQDAVLAKDGYVMVLNNRIVNSAAAAIVADNSDHVTIAGNQMIKPCSSLNNDAVQVLGCNYVALAANIIDVQGSPSCDHIVRVLRSQYVTVKDNISYGGGSVGVSYNESAYVNIQGNMFKGLSSHSVSNLSGAANTNTNVAVMGNFADKSGYNLRPEEMRADNVSAGKRDSGSGASTIADGGKIAHGLNGVPRSVIVTGSIAGQIVSVSAVDATNIVVAIKTGSGSAGTKQKVYWQADL